MLLLNGLPTAQAGQSFVIDAIDLSLPAQKYFDLNNCFVRTIPSLVSCASFKTCLLRKVGTAMRPPRDKIPSKQKTLHGRIQMI